MSSPPALLLDTVDKTTADLACSLLAAAEIPAYEHGPDFDVAELGSFAHDMLRGVSVFVPSEALGAARAVLDEAWGTDWRKA
jgi:hypothetical protein